MSAIETKADDEINDAVPAVLRGRLCHSPTLLKKSAGKIIDCIPILRDKADAEDRTLLADPYAEATARHEPARSPVVHADTT